MEGSIGFGPRRRGERDRGAAATGAGAAGSEGQEARSQQQQSASGGRRSNDNAAQEADRHDPDFDRRYSKWQAPPSLLPLPHPMYALQNPGSNFGQQQAGGGGLNLMQAQQDLNYQSMVSNAMQHQQNLNGLNGHHLPPMQAGHGYSSFPNHHLGLYGQQLPNRIPSPPDGSGMTHGGAAIGGGMSPYALQMNPPVSATGSGSAAQFASMWLPSHTPQGESWREQGFCVEPHVAKSSGVLRPTSKPESFVETAPPPSQAQYGLESLNDFPVLSNPP